MDEHRERDEHREGTDARATMDLPEVAKLLGCSRTSAYRWAKDGTLPTIRLGRRVVVPRAAIEALLAEWASREEGAA